MIPTNFVAITALLFLTSCWFYTRYDYYRFENKEKLIIAKPYTKKTTRKNIFFKNRDIQIIGEVAEKNISSFHVTAHYNAFKDSIVLNNLQVYILSDSLIVNHDSFVIFGPSKSVHFKHFNELSTEICSQRSQIYCLDFKERPKRSTLNLRLIFDYTILGKAHPKTISEVVEIEGLKRIKGERRFFQFSR